MTGAPGPEFVVLHMSRVGDAIVTMPRYINGIANPTRFWGPD